MGRPALPALSSLVLVVALAAGCGGPEETSPTPPTSEGTSPTAPTDANPLAERGQTLVVNPRLTAAAEQSAADGDAARAESLARLAAVPTGVWLTPERYAVGAAGAYAASVMASTDGATVPVFVLYGIPDRDCTGGFSAGGLTVTTYLPWVQEIAAAIGPAGVVVLEPDALAGTVSCDGDAARLRLLGEAASTLQEAGVTTYLDAGHSYWIPAPRMARLLQRTGIESARGFATNVANYQPLERERQYAARLSNLLGGIPYVIDTGRNGDPSGAMRPVDDWCNPTGQALGEEPGYVDDDTALDALLWIKPPAESDGTCHGGPAAGEVWIDRAARLAEAAGW